MSERLDQARAWLRQDPDAETRDGLAAPLLDALRRRWFVGTGAAVRERLAAFAAQHGVDEVMVSPVAGSYQAEPQETAPARVQTLTLLAA